MRVSYNNGRYVLVEGNEINAARFTITTDERRQELLCQWLKEQLEIINEKGFTNMTGSFFTYLFRPGGLGGSMKVLCEATVNTLNLTLIDDEEF